MENKSCANCKHSENVRILGREFVKWYCDEAPTDYEDFSGSMEVFKTFHCSLWTDVFQKSEKL